jgi:hypothetical protein
MDINEAAPYILFAVGVIARVVVPYIQARLASDEPLSFDWRYLAGQLIAAFVALVPLVAGQDFLSTLSGLSLIGAILYGWGAGDIGRAVQKAVAG